MSVTPSTWIVDSPEGPVDFADLRNFGPIADVLVNNLHASRLAKATLYSIHCIARTMFRIWQTADQELAIGMPTTGTDISPPHWRQIERWCDTLGNPARAERAARNVTSHLGGRGPEVRYRMLRHRANTTLPQSVEADAARIVETATRVCTGIYERLAQGRALTAQGELDAAQNHDTPAAALYRLSQLDPDTSPDVGLARTLTAHFGTIGRAYELLAPTRDDTVAAIVTLAVRGGPNRRGLLDLDTNSLSESPTTKLTYKKPRARGKKAVTITPDERDAALILNHINATRWLRQSDPDNAALWLYRSPTGKIKTIRDSTTQVGAWIQDWLKNRQLPVIAEFSRTARQTAATRAYWTGGTLAMRKQLAHAGPLLPHYPERIDLGDLHPAAVIAAGKKLLDEVDRLLRESQTARGDQP